MTRREFNNWKRGKHSPVKAIELFDGTIYKINLGKFPIKYAIITGFTETCVKLHVYKRKFSKKDYLKCMHFDTNMITEDLIENGAFKLVSSMPINIHREKIKVLW